MDYNSQWSSNLAWPKVMVRARPRVMVWAKSTHLSKGLPNASHDWPLRAVAARRSRPLLEARALGQGLGLTRDQSWTKTLGRAQAKTLVQARARPKPFSFSSFRPRHAPGTVFVA